MIANNLLDMNLLPDKIGARPLPAIFWLGSNASPDRHTLER
jgi:hypothetical protein